MAYLCDMIDYLICDISYGIISKRSIEQKALSLLHKPFNNECAGIFCNL